MLSSYRSLLGRPGARRLLLVSALSWLAFSGYVIALILAVHRCTSSYATAGAVVAVESVGAGALAPVRGRLVDRHGATGLRAIGAAHAAAGGLLTSALIGRSTAGVFVAAALLGISAPPLIGVARTRWAHVAGEQLARSGHALNAALSDGAQIAAPAAVAGIALATTPFVAVPVLVGAAASAAFCLAGDLPRRGASGRDETATAAPVFVAVLGVLRDSPGLRALAACDLATAGWLAGLEIAVIALAGRHGAPELGALILPASALGSITMSLLAGGSRSAATPATRYQTGAVLAAMGVPLTLLGTEPPVLAPILVCIGAAFGLLNVAFYELLDDVSPPAHATEAFTWLTAASSTGSALGAIVAGHLVSTSAAAPSLFICALAGCAACIAVASRGTLRTTRNGAEPTDAEVGPP